jgi:hypothetical protein
MWKERLIMVSFETFSISRFILLVCASCLGGGKRKGKGRVGAEEGNVSDEEGRVEETSDLGGAR